MTLNNIIGFLMDDAASATTATVQASSPLGSFSFINILMFAASLYVIYGGIRGKGSMYDTSNVKEGMEKQYVKTLRICFLSLGTLMLLNSIFSTLRDYFYPNNVTEPAHSLGSFTFYTVKCATVIGYVSWGIVLAGFVLTIFVMKKFTDKEAAAKKREEAEKERRNSPQYGHTLPVSAFEFDEEEKDDASK